MKDKRKKYIDGNRNLFDDQEPVTGHGERFEALLNSKMDKSIRQGTGHKKKMLVSIISIAASFLLVITIATRVYLPNKENMGATLDKPVVVSTIPDEFRTVNEYYDRQMKGYISNIMCKLGHTDPQNQARLAADLEQIIENNSAFVNEMLQNENEKVAVRYLKKHYKANMQALENIDKKLEKYTDC